MVFESAPTWAVATFLYLPLGFLIASLAVYGFHGIFSSTHVVNKICTHQTSWYAPCDTGIRLDERFWAGGWLVADALIIIGLAHSMRLRLARKRSSH
jgi:hypothetical protein